MDEFTKTRLSRLIGSFKKTHGRDISEAEVLATGVTAGDLDQLVRLGIVDKYQVTTGKGSLENRFKLHRDWHALRES